MTLTNAGIIMVELAPQIGCCQHLHPQEDPQLHPAPPRCSPKSASGSDPGSFQTTASVPGLGMFEILHSPF